MSMNTTYEMKSGSIGFQVNTNSASAADEKQFPIVGFFATLVRNIKRRQQVKGMLEMSDHQLADIGITYDDVRTVLSSPWSDDPTTHLQRIARTRK